MKESSPPHITETHMGVNSVCEGICIHTTFFYLSRKTFRKPHGQLSGETNNEANVPFLRIFWIRTDRNLSSGDLVVDIHYLQ